MLLFPLRGNLTFTERVQHWLLHSILLLFLTPQPTSPTSVKARSQLLLRARIFLGGWLNFSAQGSVLDPFLCTPSLDNLTQPCSCGHHPRADDPAPQVLDVNAWCFPDMPSRHLKLRLSIPELHSHPRSFPSHEVTLHSKLLN